MQHAQPLSEDIAPPVLSEDAAPPVSPQPGPAPDNSRMAFILDCLSSATDKRLTQGDLNKKLGTKAAQTFGLSKETVPPVVEQCVNDGYVRKETDKRSVKYYITEAGEKHLATIRDSLKPPTSSPGKIIPPATEEELQQRAAFVLNCLSSATGKSLTPGELNRKVSTKAAEVIGLSKETAPPILEQCVNDGHARKETEKRSVRYHITEAGETHLATLGDLIKPPPLRGKIIAASEPMRPYRVSYLLLKVLESPQGKLADSNASKCLDTYGREGLELNTATVKQLLRDLAAQEMLTQSGTGKSIEFTIAPAGMIRLGNAAFSDDHSFTFEGKTLNALMEAARTVGKQFGPPTVEQPKPIARADVEKTILAVFEELRRERFAVSGLVPIHEVRAEVRKQHGDAAARHDMFDEVVLGLWRQKKVSITPIADYAKATSQQLDESIPGVGQVLFYLEVAHEPASV